MKSSIEFLYIKMYEHKGIITIEEWEQAKEMHEQEIFDAWENGFREFYDGSSTPEEYYNTKFKSE